MKSKFIKILTLFIVSIAFLFPFFGCKKTGNGDTSDQNVESKSDEFIYITENKEVKILSVKDKTIKNIVVPKYIDELPVTAISDHAFKGCKNLETAYIPNCVKNMGYGVFSGCNSLAELTLPFVGKTNREKVGTKLYTLGYTFGEEPFEGSDTITQYYYFDTLDAVESADYCLPISLKTVRITGTGNTYIPYSAFRNCTMIEKIILGDGVSSVGTFAFLGVTAEIVWDNPKMDKIDEYSMSDYKGTAFNIPSSVKTIERSGLADCEFIQNIDIPDHVTTVEPYAFRGCFSAESLKLSKNVKKLSEYSFYFCLNLKNAELKDGLEEIGESAFMGCKALEKIVIPKTVKYIYIGAFKNCDKLKNIIISGDSDWICYNSSFAAKTLSAKTLSDSTLTAYYLTDRYSDYIWERL